MSVNQISQTSFDQNHLLYDRVRPDFIPEAVEFLVKALGLGKNSRVVELAAGTGKFTRAIADKGFNLTAAEPSDGMIKSFRQNFPSIEMVKGDSYNLPYATESVDGLIIAQAFHWFSDNKSLKEIARVLKPGAKLGLVWNYEDLDNLTDQDWQKKVTEFIWSFDLGLPQFRRGEWKKAFENQSYFEQYHHKSFKWSKLDNPEDIWPYWESRSYITALSSDKKKEVQNHIESIMKNVQPYELEQGKVVSKRGVYVAWAKKL